MNRATRSMTAKISSSLLLLGVSTAQAADLNCKTLPELFKAYLVSHVVVRSLDNDLKDKTITQYLEYLDGSKTILLKKDVEDIRKKLKNMFAKLEDGDCSGLTEVQDLATKRAKENEEYVRKFLGPTYKFNEKISLVFDAKKRDYAANEKDRNELLEKFVHFQISNYLSSDMKLDKAKTQLTHRYELITKRLHERTQTDLYSNFADAFSTGLDPHSSFFSKDRLEDFKIDLGLSLEGIGASLSSQDGYTVVEEIIPGGAADKAGLLKPKDKIVAVGQGTPKSGKDKDGDFVSVIDMDLRDVVKLIRGKKGTTVRLKILREGEKTDRVEVAIIRDKVELKDQAAKITYEKRKMGDKTLTFGIIDFPSFYGDDKRSSADDMKKILEEANAKKVSGLVLNLSRNGGGLLEDAYKIAGLFIKKGPVVATKNARQSVEVLADTDESITYNGPLVLLTSRVSASASEILAGALKDYHRAVIVGADHTFGKGTVQAVIPLPKDLGAMKVTTGMFYIPGGNSTQHLGVAGDILIPSPLNNEQIGEVALDNSLPPSKIPSFLGKDANFDEPAKHWKPIEKSMIDTLSSRAKDRISHEPKFDDIKKEIADAAKSDGQINLAELREKSAAEKKKNPKEDKKTVAQRIHDADAPILNEAVNVVGDLYQLLENGEIKAPIVSEVSTAAPKEKDAEKKN